MIVMVKPFVCKSFASADLQS